MVRPQEQPVVQMVVQPNGAPTHANVHAQGQSPIVSDAGYLLPPGPMNEWKDGTGMYAQSLI